MQIELHFAQICPETGDERKERAKSLVFVALTFEFYQLSTKTLKLPPSFYGMGFCGGDEKVLEGTHRANIDGQ